MLFGRVQRWYVLDDNLRMLNDLPGTLADVYQCYVPPLVFPEYKDHPFLALRSLLRRLFNNPSISPDNG